MNGDEFSILSVASGVSVLDHFMQQGIGLHYVQSEHQHVWVAVFIWFHSFIHSFISLHCDSDHIISDTGRVLLEEQIVQFLPIELYCMW